MTPALLDPTGPPARFLEAAATAPPSTDYAPTESDEKLAVHLFAVNADSFVALVETSGVSRTTIWRTLKDPAACAWITAHATKLAEAGLGAVHARLLHLALVSKTPAAIELYLKRFDPGYKSASSVAPLNVNGDHANIISMSSEELTKFVSLKTRAGGFDKDARSNDKTSK